MAYITLSKLKEYLGSNSTEFEDSELEEIIEEVNSEINQQLNVYIFREYVTYINETRENTIDGSNTIFYTKNYLGKYFGDSNGDGLITTADIKVYSVDSNGTETNLTVSSIDDTKMSITLSSAPDSVGLYIDYSFSYYDMNTPDKRIARLAKYLSLSYCYYELEFDLIGTSVRMGNISYSGINTNSKTAKYKNKYEDLLKDLKVYGSSKNRPVKFNETKIPNYRPNKFYGYSGYKTTTEHSNNQPAIYRIEG